MKSDRHVQLRCEGAQEGSGDVCGGVNGNIQLVFSSNLWRSALFKLHLYTHHYHFTLMRPHSRLCLMASLWNTLKLRTEDAFSCASGRFFPGQTAVLWASTRGWLQNPSKPHWDPYEASHLHSSNKPDCNPSLGRVLVCVVSVFIPDICSGVEYLNKSWVLIRLLTWCRQNITNTSV